jgi:hypothetical protein
MYEDGKEHFLDAAIRFEDGHEAIFRGRVSIMEIA